MGIACRTGGAAAAEAVSGPERQGETASRPKGTILKSGGVWDMPTRDLAQGPFIGHLRKVAATDMDGRNRRRGRVVSSPLHTLFEQDEFGIHAGAR